MCLREEDRVFHGPARVKASKEREEGEEAEGRKLSPQDMRLLLLMRRFPLGEGHLCSVSGRGEQMFYHLSAINSFLST